jgi:hypothetical protein
MIASPARKKSAAALARSDVAIEKQHNAMLENAGNPAASAPIEPRQTMRGADGGQTQRRRRAHMNRLAIRRIVSVLAGAAMLFGLEQGLDVKLYIAVPLAIVVYLAIKLAFGLLWGAGDKAS